MEIIITFLKNTYILLNILCFLSLAVYAMKRGWEQAKNDTAQKRKVCDSCWRDISKVNEFLDKNKTL